jgi:hypothetical protein
MRFPGLIFLPLLSLGGPAFGAAEPSMELARANVEQWVQTRQLISRTRSDWEAEREMLHQTRALYQRELAGIEEQMTRVTTNSGQVDRERSTAEAELTRANASLEEVRRLSGIHEAKLKAVVPRLPAPLVAAIQPLLDRIPSDDQTSKQSATERLQNLVGALNEIDKFNASIGIHSENRSNARGEQVAVEVLYLGLGAAFYVNASGDLAGTGNPGPAGWTWTIAPSLAPAIQEALHVYRSERPARFVGLPVTIR